MNKINWEENLSVGIQEIDIQHKKLIELINDLSEEGHKPKKFEMVLKDLLEYVRIHFYKEEKYFEEHNYPFAEEHKKEHAKFTEKVLEFDRRFNENKLKKEELLELLIEIFENHLKTHDKKYAKYFEEEAKK